jgi:UDP-N-acetylglucosamine 2-epimerase (non-hydrolysing)
MIVIHVVGARPNFIKAAPLIEAMKNYPGHFDQRLVHTGQHYDYNMSSIFFKELDLPSPDEFLNVGAGTHAEQTARVMMAFEPVVQKFKPDLVCVVGDVNSTLAAALVCSKLGIRVAHVEAGLRSGDRSMPEEINRLLTDQISDVLFTPSRDGDMNLLKEGIPTGDIHFVGNVMIDTLVKMLPKAEDQPVLTDLGIQPGEYILTTLHRPSNVDDPEILSQILHALGELGQRIPVIFPVHPRTLKNIHGLELNNVPGILFTEPFGYLDFLKLTRWARLVITDSGGIQEETTFLGVPCLTVRQNTERPVTISQGTNRLVDSHREAILTATDEILSGRFVRKGPPELWDGHAAQRIAKILML